MHIDNKSINPIIFNERAACLKNILSTILNDSVDCSLALAHNWQWIFSHETPIGAQLGLDGHPVNLPEGVPSDFTRRLWCSSIIKYFRPIVNFEQDISLCSKTEYASLKTGKSGDLAFVPINIEVLAGNEPILQEYRLGVYRKPIKLCIKENCNTDHLKHSLDIHDYKSMKVNFTEVDLFTYSALLRVNHRIHYDYIYTTQTEGFPGLVIHGPLLAQILTCYAMKCYPFLNITDMEIRAISPSFLGKPIGLNLARDEINNQVIAWSTNDKNIITMQIKLTCSFF